MYFARCSSSVLTSHDPHSSGHVLHDSGNAHSPSSLQIPLGRSGSSPVSELPSPSLLLSLPDVVAEPVVPAEGSAVIGVSSDDSPLAPVVPPSAVPGEPVV